jgi:predicted RND superfamily exporter protein
LIAWAEWLYDYRVLVGSAILLLTAFLGCQIRNLGYATHVRDLYPADHPNTKLAEKYPAFGSPLTATLVVQVKNDSIYNRQTLAKVQDATKAMELIPGVDHDQIVSIASRKVKRLEAGAGTIQASNLITGPIPQQEAELAHLRDKIRATPGILGVLVSLREDAALVQATFIERLVDYRSIFRAINDIIEKLQDPRHELYAAGTPMLMGWLYSYNRNLPLIAGVSVFTMVLFLALHMRNVAGMVTPMLVATVTTLWGFGIASLLRVDVDPLMMVLPILLVARSLSHAVQACERYFEIYVDKGNKRAAFVGSLASIFTPGTLGIITDAAGLFVIGLTPVPIMEKVALFSGFWALSLVPADVLLTPIVLAYLPVPRNAAMVVGRAPITPSAGWLSQLSVLLKRGVDTILLFASRLGQKKRRRITMGILAVALAYCAGTASKLTVGDVYPGTALLSPTAPYNVAIKRINERFAGSDFLQAVVEGGGRAAIKTPRALNLMQSFQRYMETDGNVGATFSFADLIPDINRLIHGGLPKWSVIPESDAEAHLLAELAIAGASPGEFDRLITKEFNAGSITVWYRDHRANTIERAISRAKAFPDVKTPAENGRRLSINLASGTLGLLGAINETVARSEWQNILLVAAVIFVFCCLAYRSVVAASVLLVPVIFSNLIAAAFMVFFGIGLDLNTLPVTAIGVGVGIDYGIYLLSRIREEFRSKNNFAAAVETAVSTTGRAILFTTSTLAAGLLPWCFLSELRFQADMAGVITVLLLVNMVMAMAVIPFLVLNLEPKFISRTPAM